MHAEPSPFGRYGVDVRCSAAEVLLSQLILSLGQLQRICGSCRRRRIEPCGEFLDLTPQMLDFPLGGAGCIGLCELPLQGAVGLICLLHGVLPGRRLLRAVVQQREGLLAEREQPLGLQRLGPDLRHDLLLGAFDLLLAALRHGEVDPRSPFLLRCLLRAEYPPHEQREGYEQRGSHEQDVDLRPPAGADFIFWFFHLHRNLIFRIRRPAAASTYRQRRKAAAPQERCTAAGGAPDGRVGGAATASHNVFVRAACQRS